MLLYGRPTELAKYIAEEIELIATLQNIDKKLDEFIKRKIEVLKKCIDELKRCEEDKEYQVIATETCTIIPL
ncbi:MAG: hypothetical protein ABWK05_09830 [Pyrobaculum sp.]